MAYLKTQQLIFPMEGYKVNGVPFGKRAVYDGVLWGIHLGEDCVLPVGTGVRAIGRGHVVYAALHPGSQEKGNWGHIVIIRHKNPQTKQVFYSLYAHLGVSFKRIGDTVDISEPIGFLGESYTSQNGFWEAHLHLGIYTGPWKKEVLPGYWKEGEKRTHPEWWHNPSEFIQAYHP
ncbi:MAG: M23 family metallopeptidase [Minisyncoccota bacterium]